MKLIPADMITIGFLHFTMKRFNFLILIYTFLKKTMSV